MSYGFDKPLDTVKLPQPSVPTKQAETAHVDIAAIAQAGNNLGFKSREATMRRKPGPRRTEQQDKITVTGPKRIIDQLKAHCDAMGGISYCEAIAALLDGTGNDRK
ncbi:hypothetical protein P3T31_003830 [Rhizobium sp. AN70]|nr:hypothetical protein [Rhizobium sp. AN70]